MKIAFYMFLIISTTLVGYANDGKNTSNEIKFLDISFDKSIKIAKKEKKLVMMFIHEEGGPWCGKMRRVAFKDKDVLAILHSGYTSIQFDKYQDKIDIPSHLIPKLIPMIYLIDPETSEVVIEIKGYAGTDNLLSILEETKELYDE